MTRIAMVSVAMSAVGMLALSAHVAKAQSGSVKLGPPVGVKSVHINPPGTNVNGVVSGQHGSDQGVQINIRHKRDQLQHSWGDGGTKTQ